MQYNWKCTKIHKGASLLEMMVWASGVRTGQLFRTSGTERPLCWHSRLHPCSSNDGCASFCSQSHTPPGQRRCRGRRPCRLAARRLSFLGGTVLAPSVCSWGGSSLVETPPNGNNRDSCKSCSDPFVCLIDKQNDLKADIVESHWEVNDETSLLKWSPVCGHAFIQDTLCIPRFDQFTCDSNKKH